MSDYLVRASQRGIALEPGRSYIVRGWVKIGPGSGNMSTMINTDLQDSSASFVQQTPGNYYVYDTGSVWREVHFAFRMPENVTLMILYISTTDGTGTAWFEDISIEPNPLQ